MITQHTDSLCGKEQYCRPVVNWVATREQMCICASVAQVDDYDDVDIWGL